MKGNLGYWMPTKISSCIFAQVLSKNITKHHLMLKQRHQKVLGENISFFLCQYWIRHLIGKSFFHWFIQNPITLFVPSTFSSMILFPSLLHSFPDFLWLWEANITSMCQQPWKNRSILGEETIFLLDVLTISPSFSPWPL